MNDKCSHNKNSYKNN